MKTQNLLWLVSLSIFQSTLCAQAIGELDNIFGSDGIVVASASFDNVVTGLAVQNDHKIIAAGYSFNGLDNDAIVVRYNEDGTIDESFGTDGVVVMDFGYGGDGFSDVIIREGGKILLAGSADNAENNDFLLTQLNSDGSADMDFGIDNGTTIFDAGGEENLSDIMVDSEGRILAAGSTTGEYMYECAVIRFTDNGIPDATFGTGGYCKITGFGHAGNILTNIIELSDHKIAACGISQIQITNRFAVVRLNENGTPDSTFSDDGIDKPDFGTALEIGVCLTEQADGKLLVCGDSYTNGIDINFAFVRYNYDGSPDNPFGTEGKMEIDICGNSEYMKGMAIQPDGKMIFGAFAHNGDNFDFMVTRLNADMTIDEDFGDTGKTISPVGDSTEFVWEMILQPDGKILLGGSTYNGTDFDFAILRYNSGLTINVEENSPADYVPLIFPNPTCGDVSIDGGKFKEETNIEIYNTLGELKYRNSFAPEQDVNFTINGDAGMYIVLMRTEGKTYTTTIIKE